MVMGFLSPPLLSGGGVIGGAVPGSRRVVDVSVREEGSGRVREEGSDARLPARDARVSAPEEPSREHLHAQDAEDDEEDQDDDRDVDHGADAQDDGLQHEPHPARFRQRA